MCGCLLTPLTHPFDPALSLVVLFVALVDMVTAANSSGSVSGWLAELAVWD